ncbi:hypothetical protein MJM04_30895, partial [Salmonella enterica subsp. enterica serovar Cerro]|nr:hypothetical protein [Salmonella enterica subsp. enterica serovar Cerro]
WFIENHHAVRQAKRKSTITKMKAYRDAWEEHRNRYQKDIEKLSYFLTIFAGTGNISLATLPVIAEVAKEQGIKPCRPLSTAVVSA